MYVHNVRTCMYVYSLLFSFVINPKAYPDFIFTRPIQRGLLKLCRSLLYTDPAFNFAEPDAGPDYK